MLRYRQSSLDSEAAPESWAQGSAKAVVCLTPLQGMTGCGACQRRSPTGGAANGRPLKAATPLSTTPRTLPPVTSACTKLQASSFSLAIYSPGRFARSLLERMHHGDAGSSMPFLDRCLLAGHNSHGAPCCLREGWWQIWWQIWGGRGIGGDIDCSVRQQLTDSYSHLPEFESLSL